LDRLVGAGPRDQRRVLVIRGEAGVGKTALLEYLEARATGWRIAHAAGVESEMELAFAGLHQLCAPMLHLRDGLPEPQQDALGTAFGLAAGARPDRFLVGLATLGLLGAVAEERPLVCVVDDAHWLDQASAQAVAFVARRVVAEPIALVIAVRGSGDDDVFSGLPELVLPGLADGDARALLDSVVPGRLDARVRDRIVAETRGNPLALVELTRGLTVAELAGGFGLPDARPLADRIEQTFSARLQALPIETQRLLLVAAAEPVGDVHLLRRAADRLGIGPDAAARAEEAGLLALGARVRFHHPLVRSAAYRAATDRDRREVHGALAEATDPDADPDRRAWHRAQAADGPDEATADELERSAVRARRRGGVAAEAAFLERATELTPDPARRGGRALAAAQAKFEAAALDAADRLLALAAECPLDELQMVRLMRMRAQIAFARRRGHDAPPLLLDAARRLEPLDGALAREGYLEALGAAIHAGRLSGSTGTREVAEAAARAPSAPHTPRPIDVLLDGLATRFTEGYVASVPLLRQALRAFAEPDGAREHDVVSSFWLSSLVTPELVAMELWDDETWHVLATRAVRAARDAGALGVLPIALTYHAGALILAGELARAAELIDEAQALLVATGGASLSYTSPALAAWRGDEQQALPLIEALIEDATTRGEGRAVGFGRYATAVLYNGLGRHDFAVTAARQACEHDDLVGHGWALVELVEAAARSGAPDIAADAFARLEERTRAVGTEWALGVEACSRAVLSEGSQADALYREAAERLARSRVSVLCARARLLHGEWLRAEKRRGEARDQLRAAHDLFDRMGAAAFAERARRELQAAGETVRGGAVGSVELTTQEAQIARLAGAGCSNPEIARQLFISPRTVEYHLGKVFTKLGIGSRKELHRHVPEPA
jgi:DNA-binding CsgD family transcriptional regulator